MTRPVDRDGGRPALSMDRIAAYRRSSNRPAVRVQIERLSADLANLSALTTGGHPVPARGVALAVAHAALKLAVTPIVGADERRHRSQVLRNVVVPALDRSGLDHVGPLIEAALMHDGDPTAFARGVEKAQ